MFEYLYHTLEEGEDINGWLNKRGLDGWRLHTFNQLEYSGTVTRFYIVMDRFYPNQEQPSEQSGGMAMKG